MKRTIEEYMAMDYPFIVVPFREEGFCGYRSFFINIPAIESIGKTPEEALLELNEVKKEWMTFAIEKGIEIPEPETNFHTTMKYSGRVTLRMPKTLHRQATERALLYGVSLNSYLNEAIQRGMGKM